jgi:hypothetical protein
VVNHLGIAWQATPIGAIDPEEFYDFQVNRPVIEIEDGHTKRLIWPTTRISLARAHPADGSVPPTGLSRDVILVHGIEPNMRWRAFSEELVRSLESLGVELVILLGALLADAPHTRPVPVSVGSSNAKLASEVAGGGVSRVLGLRPGQRDPGRRPDKTLGLTALDLDYRPVDLEIVEVLGIDGADRGRLPRDAQVVDHPAGGLTGIVPALEPSNGNRSGVFADVT